MSTYRHLITPVPLKNSIADISKAPPCQPCEPCKAALPDRAKAKNMSIHTEYERVDEYPEFPALSTSAKSGCGLCRIIRKALRQNWAARPMEEWGVGPLSDDDSGLLDEPWDGKVRIFNLTFQFAPLGDASLAHAKQMGGVITGMTLEFGPASMARSEDGSALHGNISQVIGFKAYDSVDLEAAGHDQLPMRRLPSPESLSAENIEMMRQWIRDCQSNHVSCRIPASSRPWLPTRLLDVGSAEDDKAPRLVETSASQVEGDVTYAALSHMWGSEEAAPPFRTIQFNYEELKAGIPMSLLPRNFRDAIETCRRLDVPFIWIDSLCIIQDSIDDWQREAKEMHNVYKHAKFTIVATSATSSHDGFLARNLSLVPAIKTRYSISGHDQPRFLILSPLGNVEAGLRVGDVDGSRWNTRGWTMQERSLSTRTLHFCKNKIYFECREHLGSEEHEPEPGGSRYMWPRPPADGHPIEQSTWYERWKQAVVDYSRRRLTVPSDKLTAIRSLANEMDPHMEGSGYMPDEAMWTGDFTNELLWYVRGIPRQPRQRRAPSWSWASLDATITFAAACRSLGTVNRFKLTAKPVEPDPYDADPPTEMLLQGFVRLIGAGGLQQTEDQYRSTTHYQYDILDDEGRRFAHGNLDFDGRDGLLTRNNPLMYVHAADDRHPTGLILESYDNGKRWSRVGVATIFDPSKDLGLIDPEGLGKLEKKTIIWL